MEQERIFQEQWICVRSGHAYRERERIGIYSLPLFDRETGIAHGFSARMGGVSRGGLASLNLSFSRPEPRENVLENYRRFCHAAGFPWESMVMNSYEHGTTVLRVDAADRLRGFTRDPLPHCDGLVTNDPNVTLITVHADCMPLYFYDPAARCIGLAHAGWRGAYGRIGTGMVRMLCEEYGAKPENILAGVGPCICGKCFEVDEDLGRRFLDAFPDAPCAAPGKPGKAYVDLRMVAACQLIQAGVLPEHIEWMDICTYEDGNLFSHRRDRGNTGAMCAYLRLL